MRFHFLSFAIVFILAVSVLFSFPFTLPLASARKTFDPDTPKPTPKAGEKPSKFLNRLARWWTHFDDCPPEMQAHADKVNKAANNALKTAKEVSKTNATLTSAQQYSLDCNQKNKEKWYKESAAAYKHRNEAESDLTDRERKLLASSDAKTAETSEAHRLSNIDRSLLTERQVTILRPNENYRAERSEARRLRHYGDRSLLSERQLSILSTADAYAAELAEAKRLRNTAPSRLTERQLSILSTADAYTDRRSAELAAERARLGRISQAAWLGAELLVHTVEEISSIIEYIREAINLYLLLHPRAAINIGSVSFDLAEFPTLSLEKMIQHHIEEDGQCIVEGGRSGTYDPCLRYDIHGNFMTIPEFLAMGGFLQIVHFTLNPSDNGVERGLQLLHRQFNPIYAQGAVLNGGLRASGNLWTQAGRICQTGLLILPDRTAAVRFPRGFYDPWPVNKAELTPATLGPTADPMPLRAVPHLGESFLHVGTNDAEMRAKVVEDVKVLLRNRGSYVPLLSESWDGRVMDGLRVTNSGHRFAANPQLSSAMARLGLENAENYHGSADLLVVTDAMLNGGKVPSNAAYAAKRDGTPIASLTSFTRAVFEASEGYDDDDDDDIDGDDFNGDSGGRSSSLLPSSSIAVSDLNWNSGQSSSSSPSSSRRKIKKRKILPTFAFPPLPPRLSDEERARQVESLEEADFEFDAEDDDVIAPVPPPSNSSILIDEVFVRYPNSLHTEAFEQPLGSSMNSSLPLSTTSSSSSTSTSSSSSKLESRPAVILMDGEAISAFLKTTKPRRPTNVPLFRNPSLEVGPFLESFSIDAIGNVFNPSPQEPRRALKRPANDDDDVDDDDDDSDDLSLAPPRKSPK